MHKLTVSEAVKLAGISRQHFYKTYITPGKISVIKDGAKSIIELSELLRVFPDVKLATDLVDSSLHMATPKDDMLTHDSSQLVNMLKTQLAEAKDREEWLKTQIDELRQQQNNLLEDKTARIRKRFLGIF